MVLAGTIVLTALFPQPFPGWPVWGWPVLGLLGVGLLFFSSVNDAQANARVLMDLYRQQFDPQKIRDQGLRQEVEAALDHQRRIEEQRRGRRRGALRDWLANAANQFGEWIGDIYRLALRLDVHRRGELLVRERKELPRQVDELAARRRLERDPVIRRELEAALEAIGTQWQSLHGLDARMEQAEVTLKNSVTALASIYGQVELMNDGDVSGGRAVLLEADIQKQVDGLDGLIRSITQQCQGISNAASGGKFSI